MDLDAAQRRGELKTSARFHHVGRAKRSKLGALKRGAAFFRLGKLRKGRLVRGAARSRAPGKLLRRQFMEPVFQQLAERALDLIQTRIAAGLETAVERVRGKAA